MKFACETCGGRGWFATSAVDAFPNPCPSCKGTSYVDVRERSQLLRHVLLGRARSATCVRVLRKIPEAWLGEA